MNNSNSTSPLSATGVEIRFSMASALLDQAQHDEARAARILERAAAAAKQGRPAYAAMLMKQAATWLDEAAASRAILDGSAD